MGRHGTRSYLKKDNSLEQLFKHVNDSNGEDLEKLMEWAKKEAESDSCMEKYNIPEAPEDEYSKILAKMESRNIQPKLIADFDEEGQKACNSRTFLGMRMGLERKAEKDCIEPKEISVTQQPSTKKKYFFQFLEYIGIAAASFTAVTAIILLKPGLGVVAKKRYEYHSTIREDGGIVWDNQDDYITDKSRLEKVYDEIKEKLGIAVLKLNYIPEDMKLSSITVENGHAKLEFTYGNTFFYMFEVLYSVDNSDSRFSDREAYTIIENEWLNQKIPIKRNLISTGIFEYNAYTEIDNAYYYFEGIMAEDEFLEIIKNLSLER